MPPVFNLCVSHEKCSVAFPPQEQGLNGTGGGRDSREGKGLGNLGAAAGLGAAVGSAIVHAFR